MKNVNLTAILLISTLPLTAAAEAWQKPQALQNIQASAAQLQTLFKAPNPVEASGSGENLKCLPFGYHTESIPSYHGAGRRCGDNPYPADKSQNPFETRDPLAMSAQYTADWTALVQKLHDPRVGGEPREYKPYGKGTSEIGYRQVVWYGNTQGLDIQKQHTPVDKDSHWGDVATLMLNAQKEVVGVEFHTLRSYSMHKSDQPAIEYVERWFFHVDYKGKMYFVQSQDAGVSQGQAMWPPAQDSYRDGPYSFTNGSSVIYWNQLLKAWTERLKTLP